MAKYMINGDTLDEIADAIRTKNGETAQIPTTSMAAKILALSLMPAGVAAFSAVSFVPKTASEEIQVQHSLGVTPDLYFLYGENAASDLTGRYTFAVFEYKGALVGGTAYFAFTAAFSSNNGYVKVDTPFEGYNLASATEDVMTVSPIEGTSWRTNYTYHLVAVKLA